MTVQLVSNTVEGVQEMAKERGLEGVPISGDRIAIVKGEYREKTLGWLTGIWVSTASIADWSL